MKKLLLTILPILFLLFSCEEFQKVNDEKIFYHKLDSLKSEYIGKEITISKRKFDEVSDPLSKLYLYTNSDKDNLGSKVRLWSGAKYNMAYDQIPSYEYQNNLLDKNLMIKVEFNQEGFDSEEGWISLENIKEFQAIEPFLESIK